MQAFSPVRRRSRKWRICPWVSLRASLLSLICVAAIAIFLDRIVLASLERQGLVASEGWKRHNQVVLENHHRKDRKIPSPGPQWASPRGVRAWTGHEVTKERSRPHRILVMGDSFVWDASYLTLNHMWWRQLAIELQRRGYNDVEVIAAGTSGMSTHEELDQARHVVPEFHPDLILWGFVTNDPDERLVKQINNSQLAPPIPGRVQSVLRRVTPRLLDLFLSRRSEKLAKCYLGPEYGYEYSDWLHRIHEGKNFEQYRQTVADVSQFMKEMKTTGMMVTLPEAPIADRFAFSYDKVIPLWQEAGIPVQDNLPAFVSRYPNVEASGPQSMAWGINPADGHPGPHSTAILAQLTADRLEQDFPQVLGEKSSPPNEIRINDWLPYDLDVTPSGDGRFKLTYPDTEEFLPTMPLEIPTALIALERPQPLGEIHLKGAGLKSARVWLSTYDPMESYDTQQWKDLGLESGTEVKWTIPEELSRLRASVILIHADFDTNDRHLQLQLHKSNDSKERRSQQ